MSEGLAADDEVVRRILWSLPTGLYLLGSVGEVGVGPWNLMTISLVTQVATEPRLVGLSVEVDSLSAELIAASGVAALSILGRDHRSLVRRFVKPAANVEIDGGAHLATMSGEKVRLLGPGGAPVHVAAAAWVALEVRQSHDLGSHILFLAAPTTWGATPDFLAGRASQRLFDVLRMEDTKMNYGG